MARARMAVTPSSGESAPSVGPRRRFRPGAVEVFIALLVVGVLARSWLVGHTASPRVLTWLTIFVSIVIQATPFVVLGTVISAAIAALVPPSFFARALPRRPVLAVPMAGVAGAILPGCECGSVPLAGAPIRRRGTPAAALALLLSPPALNPVLLVAAPIAVPGPPPAGLPPPLAIVAASLTQFSLTARLAFLVVGPMVDAKLFAMQAGAFGRRFATRFAPAAFVVAVLAAVAVGTVLL